MSGTTQFAIILFAGLILIAMPIGVIQYLLETDGDNAAAMILFIMPWGAMLMISFWSGVGLFLAGIAGLLAALIKRVGKGAQKPTS